MKLKYCFHNSTQYSFLHILGLMVLCQCMFFTSKEHVWFQGGEEPDPGAEAAAGWSLPGFSPCRPGEGPKEKRGGGAGEAGGGEGPTECSGRGAETTGESYFPLHLCCTCPYSVYVDLDGWIHHLHYLFWVHIVNSLLWLQTLEEEKERKSECLPPEPLADDPESVKIVFKLPNDTRVERRFLFGQSLTVSTTVIKTLCTPS